MKLSNVWVVEGVSGDPADAVAAFDLQVGPDGWKLSDTEQPSFERQWSWETIGGLEVVRGAGKTPDGRPATALDVIVNGWLVRLLVPTEEMSFQTITMLGAFAPLGHPLRGSPRVIRAAALQRWSDAARGYVRARMPRLPVFLPDVLQDPVSGVLRRIRTTRLGSALVVCLVLVATAVGASIAGVATSAAPTSIAPGKTTPPGNDAAAAGGGSSSTSAGGSTSSSPSNAPAVAASSGGHGSGRAALIVVRPPSGSPSSPSQPTDTKATGTTSKSTNTTTKSTNTTTNGTTTNPQATTSSTGGVTTTRPPRSTTTTRPPRPRPTTTTTTEATTTTQATTTTTQATTTTTQDTTTTTQAATTTTAGLLALLPALGGN